MAREHARIQCSIWKPGDDFRHRSAPAQRLFFVLLSQREINNAGVLPLMIGKWAKLSADTTVGDIRTALAELVEHRYVVVDEDTEQALVRTYIRNDGVMNHPFTRKSAMTAAESIDSPLLRREVAEELRRIGHPEALATADKIDPPSRPAANGVGAESQRDQSGVRAPTYVEHAVGVATGDTERDQSGVTVGDTEALHPSDVEMGKGRGKGKSLPVGGRVGEARERATDQPPPTAEPSTGRPADRCSRHLGTTHDGPCRACATAREAAARWDADDARRRVMAARRCTWCDPEGWRIDPANRHRGPLAPGRRCDHTPLTPEMLGAST
jgi:hypothetical protein